ncbi:MAG: toxin-antitoxin system TumE family protein [Blastocatellia bacterium]
MELDFDRADAVNGVIDGVLYFYDGSRLEFTEVVAIDQPRPVKLSYRYQYIRADEAVFRYDNAKHHPGLSTHPHHKHAGGNIVSAVEPTLSQILDEVAACLRETANVPPTAPKRRRQRKPRR